MSSKFRLPRVLKKVEHTNARLDFKCFFNNQRNFFIYVFNNHFNWRKHFVCFVSCVYHCTCLSKVCVCSSIIIQRDSSVWILMLWFEMECFEWTLSKREELYAVGKRKIIRWNPLHKNEYLTFLTQNQRNMPRLYSISFLK